MGEDFKNNSEQGEDLGKPIFKITLMRHEEPFYKDEGHDLTEKGVEEAKKTGARLRQEGAISEEDEMYLLHSPKPRAQGTLEFVAEGAEINDAQRRRINVLRQSHIPNKEVFMNRVAELGNSQEAVAEDHYTNPMYEENPDFIEPNSKKKARLYRALEYLVRWVDKTPKNGSKTPHILAVSHFEIITHLIDDVFGIASTGKYNSPSFGEAVHIEGLKSKDPKNINLKITYNEQTKLVQFNRTTRSVNIV